MKHMENNIEHNSAPVTQQAPTESRKLSMPVAILLAGIIIALAVLVSGRGGIQLGNGGKIKVQEAGNAEKVMEPVTSSDHIRGNLEKAKVAVVEFSDLQCPYCKQIHPILAQMSEAYGDDVVWVYRHFPLESIHPRARISAHASECVAELAGNDGFWKFIDGIFTFEGDPLTDENLALLATSAGANTDAFKACQTEGKYDSKIDAHLTDASLSGAGGTPDVTVINLKTGEAIHIGADPSLLAEVIEKMLK